MRAGEPARQAHRRARASCSFTRLVSVWLLTRENAWSIHRGTLAPAKRLAFRDPRWQDAGVRRCSPVECECDLPSHPTASAPRAESGDVTTRRPLTRLA